jgi:hypothetical protein
MFLPGFLQLSDLLAEQDIPNVLYHKNIPKEERDAALAAFADTAAAAAAGGAAGNVVMVSTDAAARGIDLPNVTHVVQVGARLRAVLVSQLSAAAAAAAAAAPQAFALLYHVKATHSCSVCIRCYTHRTAVTLHVA